MSLNGQRHDRACLKHREDGDGILIVNPIKIVPIRVSAIHGFSLGIGQPTAKIDVLRNDVTRLAIACRGITPVHQIGSRDHKRVILDLAVDGKTGDGNPASEE